MRPPKPPIKIRPPEPGELCGLPVGDYVCTNERHHPSQRHFFERADKQS